MKTSIVLSLALLASAAFSATNDEIITHFKNQIPLSHIQIKVLSRQQISKDLDYVSLHITDGQNNQNISIFTHGDYIFPDAIDLKTGMSIKDKMQRVQINKNIAKVFKAEDPKYIISIGHDPQKETLVIFSDPECPFCKKELDGIENDLKKYNIKMIFTPVHDRSSLAKSYLIYKYIKDAKTDAQKIKIIRKYFESGANEQVNNSNVQKIDTLRQKYFQAGINGTPYKVMEKDLQ
ncbi:thioredoxin domain-containing protein [Sulfurospirillum sp. 1612]|uniref:thioredoxin domain-containing protein n=1 Tax=Sulfurospirillum sp. 1612 TaxID=3094835 RepID=UPI002F95320C